jgi:hypothetical protein
MRTVRTKVYQFSELSEQAKQKALENLFDINVSFDWWESTYEDARNIGLKITGFDIDRGSYVKGSFINDANYTANKIKSDHVEMCETYKTATQFLSDWDKLVEKYSDGINKDVVTEENEYDFDKEADDLEDEFFKSICEDYRIILQKEAEYLQSKEAIIETIEANEYEFTKDGERFNR